jgi:hypothetical protein
MIFQNLPKVDINLLGENSPNLITLIGNYSSVAYVGALLSDLLRSKELISWGFVL